MLRRAFLAALAGAAVAVSCSSFDSSDDTPADAGADAPVADAGPDGVDAAPPVDAGPPFCSTVDASFCWSFDDDTQNALLGPSMQATGLRPKVVDAGLSAPNAMLAHIEPGANEGSVGFALPELHSVACELDLFVESVTPSSAAEAFSLLSTNFKKSPSVLLSASDPMTVKAELLVLGLPSVAAGNVPVGKWTHLKLATTIDDAGTQSGTVDIAGSSPTTTTWNDDAGASTVGPYKTRFGLANGFGAQAWSARYDNIVCRYE